MLLFYISPNLTTLNYGGSVVARANLEALQSLNNLDIKSYSIHSKPISTATQIDCTRSRHGTVLANLFLLGATLTFRGLFRLIQEVRKHQPDVIWLDSSYFGILILILRLFSPKTKYIVYFQNIEKHGVVEMAKKKPLYWMLFPSVCFNEKFSTQYSDVICTIQSKDQDVLRKIVPKKIFYTLPIAVEDNFKKQHSGTAAPFDFSYNLFVGSDFPPNIEALNYLNRFMENSKNVLPVVVVGRGLEKYVNLYKNLKIIGGVDHLENYYLHATFILAPIYSGGGMKVKIAEALMHAKTVLSSPFAAIGYESTNDKAVKIFNSEQELRQLIDEPVVKYNSYSRESYLQYYSKVALVRQVNDVINDVRVSV